MKFGFLLCSLLAVMVSIGQENHVFDTSRVDAKTKLVGFSTPYSKKDVNRHKSFIVRDPELIKKVIVSLPKGKLTENRIEEEGLGLYLIQDFETIGSHIINPNLSTIIINGKYYEFDVKKLTTLTNNHICDYQIVEKTFKNRTEFDLFLESQKADASFLYNTIPDFKTEVSFEIQFPNNREYSSPRDCVNYLNPLIEKIVGRSKYLAIYKLDEKNKYNQNQFTITVIGSKRIFDELKLKNLEKKNWITSTPKASFYYFRMPAIN